MKKYILLLFYVATIAFSCSEDNNSDDTPAESDGLVGTWLLTDIRIDAGTNDDDLNFAKQILGFLQGIDCELITFTFNESGTLDTDSKVDHLSINVGTGGLDIPCPTEVDEESALWVLNGDQLTISKEGEADEAFTIELDGNTLIVPGESVDANNYAGADAVFTRQ
ncbi:lipocalin family protein [Flagellimonas flava]|uniref:Lipocalin-like domain-containing protein n=1 Tax=Flagellimonas flava TaxID=570519 RepID=A0A1M5LPS1_9FLAO|nr:lipocalin family protein [Allomuricauda flava]SHG67077.1 Lipocalin-like domain-containing protein [Allomuricauda flava]